MAQFWLAGHSSKIFSSMNFKEFGFYFLLFNNRYINTVSA